MNKYILPALFFVLVLAVGGFLLLASGAQEDNDSLADTSVNTAQEESLDQNQEISEEQETTDPAPAEVNTTQGSFTSYSEDKLTNDANILFFAASWCSTCQALKRDINSNLSDIPADMQILELDYDTETALKAKYGVRVQHTLVQVDKDGNMINSWIGGNTLDYVLNQV